MDPIISTGQRKTFSKFLEKVDTDKISGLKKKIMDYILERAKIRGIHKLRKKCLEDIEEQVEDIVDETVDLSLDDLRREELEELNTHKHTHFDKYDPPEKNGNVIIIDHLPKKHLHFDRYELTSNSK